MPATRLFLLGGHDLEMLTIGEIAKAAGYTVIDRNLRWDNAMLSAYADVLQEADDDTTIYGIELREDITPPAHYRSIDHHGDRQQQPSALEQVATLLGISLSRRQQLIAANDRGYIPAMQALGATPEEIDAIRHADRAAQGVTPQDEQLAEEAIANTAIRHNDLIIVHSATSHFSTITDRLYPYRRLLIYTDREWLFYGEGKERLVKTFEKEIRRGDVYHGGGPAGYIGSKESAFDKQQIKEMVAQIDSLTAYSFHCFMFPFQWRIDGYDERTMSEQVSLNNIIYHESSRWLRHSRPTTEELSTRYNEQNYFYTFIHAALYDTGDENTLLRQYEVADTHMEDVRFIIESHGGTTYNLKCKGITLNLYSTGVGVLSFSLYNHNYPEPADVLRINQSGRRLFPTFIGDVKARTVIADRISILGLRGANEHEYSEDFNGYSSASDANNPASFINRLIYELATNIKIKPVVDDRMFVHSWYKNDKWAADVKSNQHSFFIDSDQWYEYTHVDKLGERNCHNEDLKRCLSRKHTYERWQEKGTLYGVTRNAMTCLMGCDCPPFLPQYFETIYARLSEIALVQRASVLRFSAEVTRLSDMHSTNHFSQKVSSLYKEYIRFVNKIHFREVSAQEQGDEIYKRLYEVSDIEQHVTKLDENIEELFNYVRLEEERKSSNTMSTLTWIATVGVPITVSASIFGMNNSVFTGDGLPSPHFYNNVLFQLGIATFLILISLSFIFIRKKGMK